MRTRCSPTGRSTFAPLSFCTDGRVKKGMPVSEGRIAEIAVVRMKDDAIPFRVGQQALF